MRNEARIASALTVERSLSFLDKIIDAVIIVCLIKWGPVHAFAVGVGLSFVFSLGVLELHLQTSKRGFDITGVDHLKEWAFEPTSRKGSWVRRIMTMTTKALLRFLSRSYWTMMLIGSVVYLECDYVTLFLRKKGEGRLSVVFRVMIPSVLWGVGVWTALYWLTLTYATHWFERLAGCAGETCLTQPEWQWVVHAIEWLEALLQQLASFL
ncbi:MAG: hypothetical protein AAB921_01115 [Patescibacteria group bacterium]